MIADDDPVCNELMTRIVGSLGIRIFNATNGKEALQILDDQVIESLVTDFEMPTMNGEELIRTVTHSHKETKLIVLVSGSAKNIAPYRNSRTIHTCHKRDMLYHLKDHFCKIS